ncbi:helix-turn-helix domain-containing protein [Roseovarius sp. E0-M6]|uniref:helix-turn-helix domain-containing protein n=1 Tax=Roseovarius sp. E0-M6 TaxID=3127118 RepID=UPI00300F9042
MAKNDVAASGLAGTRIRERRLLAGIKQAELAVRAEISPSYLNLIEHNRRRIGGSVLLRLAEALGVEPAVLTQGPAAALVSGLREIAARAPERADEAETVEEFAERFPVWAGRLIQSQAEIARLEQSVDALTDRLTHDPDLAGRLHEVLSVVTAIRSTASILVETPEIEPQWRDRFHRNIHQDSRRLAEGAEALVSYLDAAPGEALGAVSPQEELDAFLDVHGHHFPPLERRDGGTVARILDGAEELRSDAARMMALEWLNQYRRDARDLPLDAMARAVADLGPDPLAIAAHLKADAVMVCRRLAALPQDMVGEIGYVLCDGAGALVRRRAVAGFATPRGTGACPLWPVFHALGQASTPLKATVMQATRDARPMTAYAVCEVTGPSTYGSPAPRRAHMLLIPERQPSESVPEAAEEVGITCRVCSRSACPARREPSILREAF